MDKNAKKLFVTFSTLLVALLVLTLLFATGLLRFSLSAQSAYVVYVISGLLTAVVTFGQLQSTGAFDGTGHGATIRLSGSIVGACLVIGGGIYFENHRPHESFDCRMLFVDPSGNPTKLKGAVHLLYGTQDQQRDLKEDTTILFQGIPLEWKNTSHATVVLDCPPYRVVDGDRPLVLDDQVDVHVEPDKTAATVDPVPSASVAMIGSALPGPPPLPRPLEIVDATVTKQGELDVTFRNRNDDPSIVSTVQATITRSEGASVLPILSPSAKFTLVFPRALVGATADVPLHFQILPHADDRLLIAVRLPSAATVRFEFHYDVGQTVSVTRMINP